MSIPQKEYKKALAKVEKFSVKFEVFAHIKKACKAKGCKLKALTEISEQTGITLSWLQKFAQNPNGADPGLSKIENLYFHFKGVSISDNLKRD